MSREGVAFRSHISVRTLENIEAGRRGTNVYTALAIARVLETTVESLFPVDVPEVAAS